MRYPTIRRGMQKTALNDNPTTKMPLALIGKAAEKQGDGRSSKLKNRNAVCADAGKCNEERFE